jgi:hypothetical protein
MLHQPLACHLLKTEPQTFNSESSDGKIIWSWHRHCQAIYEIKTVLEDLEKDDEGDDGPVPLPSVNAQYLKAIQWYNHKDGPSSENDEGVEKEIGDILVWGQEFLRVKQWTLFKLILAADSSGTRGLLHVTSQWSRGKLRKRFTRPWIL